MILSYLFNFCDVPAIATCLIYVVNHLAPVGLNNFIGHVVLQRLDECQHFLSEAKADAAVDLRVIVVVVVDEKTLEKIGERHYS